MIILLFFLTFWSGLSIKYCWYIFIPVCLGLLIVSLRKLGKKSLIISLLFCLLGVGISFIYIDNKGNDFSGLVIEAKENYFLILSKGEKLYVSLKEHGYEVGDYLSLQGEKNPLNFTRIESQFDFETYLNKKGIKYEVEIKSIKADFLNPIRINKNKKEFLSHFDNETQTVVSTLLFGNHEEGNVVNNLEFLHLSRLVSMSGFYLYVFLDGLSFLFSFLLKKKYSRLASLGFLIPYFIFTYPRFSVIRIIVIELLKWINKYPLKEKFSNLDLIGIAGLFFLSIDPNLGAQDSFIMGMSLPILSSFVYQGHPEAKDYKLKLISTGIMYFALIPFELKFYQGINIFMLPQQYFLTPLMMLFSISCLLCFYKIPIYPVVSFFYKGINGITDFFRRFNLELFAPEFHHFVLFVYVASFILFVFYRVLNHIKLKSFFMATTITFVLINIIPFSNLFTNSVSFINVGQGDSCLIRSGNVSVMIDTGGSLYTDIANDTLIPFLKKNRIYDLDLVITTHNDYDHSGALTELNKNFKIKNYVNDDDKFPISIGGITFTNYNNHIDELEDDNEKSLVIGFKIGKINYLIMGDASIEIEKNIIKEYKNIPCDVLKVGHHGSKTSTCKEFVGFLSPKEAIVSVGRNYYGHPDKEVIKILNSMNVTIRRTDLEGTISYNTLIWV